MAIIKKDGNFMGLPMNIARGNPIPLDTTEVWYSWEDLVAYAAAGATAYVGQIVQLVNEEAGTATAYIISNEAGDLVEVGSATIGDNKTIELNADGVLRLVGSANAEVGAQLVMGENGTITWVKPDTTTVEGLNSAVATLQSTVSDHGTRLSSAEDDITALEAKFAGMGGIFNFAGSFTGDEFANKVASDFDAGDVVLVDGVKEYVCVELEDGSKRWEILGDPSGVQALEGRVDSLETWKTSTSSSLSTLSSDVNTAKSNIEALQAKDTELAGEIATKASQADLATLQGEVTTNANDIDDIEKSISNINSSLDTKVDNTTYNAKVTELTNAINAKADQEALDNAIASMATDTELEQGLAQKVNKSDYDSQISTLTSADDALSQRVTTLETTTSTHATDIESLKTAVAGKASQSDVNAISSDVGTLKTTVAEHTGSINTLTTGLTSAQSSISSLDTNKADKTALAETDAKVVQNAKDITAFAERVTAAESDIDTLQSDLEEALGDIGANATAAQAAMDKAEAVLGAEGDSADAATVYGAKAAAQAAMDKAVEVLGAEGDEASANTVYGAKAAAAAAQADVDALEKTVNDLDTAYQTADSALDARIDKIEDVIGGVQGAMHFVGVSITDPASNVVSIPGKDDYTPINGDVVIYKDDSNNSIEYIYSDGSWVELGDVSAEAKRIADLEASMKTAQDDIDAVEGRLDIAENSITTLTTGVSNLETGLEDVVDINTAQAEAIARLSSDSEALDQRLQAIEDDYLKSEDRTALEDLISAETTVRTNAINAVNTTISNLDSRVETVEAQLQWTKMGS